MTATQPTTKKITAATFKSFVSKNRQALQVACKSSFDGMIDGLSYGSSTFKPAADAVHPHGNNLGIAGVWLVGRSNDYFTAFNKNGMVGIEVSNCCGCFTVAIPA